jgi:hypothetical protein
MGDKVDFGIYRVDVDSGLELPIKKCVGVDSGVDIR